MDLLPDEAATQNRIDFKLKFALALVREQNGTAAPVVVPTGAAAVHISDEPDVVVAKIERLEEQIMAMNAKILALARSRNTSHAQAAQATCANDAAAAVKTATDDDETEAESDQ